MASVTSTASTSAVACAGDTTESASSKVPDKRELSLLERLKCPTRSELSRKRQVEKPKQTGSSNKKHKPGAANVTDPKSVSPTTRVKEFPGECLSVKGGKLFCTACREELALKKSTIKNHIESGDKHQKAKEKISQREARERDIAESLRAYDKDVQPAGTQIRMDERVFRVRVVEQFLRAGIPLVKIDELRGLLEEGALRLSHSSHLADYIPPILKSEKQSIRKELEGKYLSVVFDGTSRLGEALAVVVRYCSGWTIKQKLAKSLCGEEVAREVLTILSTELGIPSSHLLAVMRDRASVNNVAVRTLTIMYPSAMDIGCFSHTLSHVGENFQVPTLDRFMKHWEQIFKHSHKCRLLWREQTGRSVATYSPTRWWSKWECEKQVLELFGDVSGFLNAIGSAGAAPKTYEKLQQLLLTKSHELMIELAVTVDIGEPFVTATYKLEGDGPLALECYEILSRVSAAVQVCHLPNTAAVAKRIASATMSEQYWVAYAKTCVQPGLDYFRRKFDTELLPAVSAFKAARLFLPSKINDLKPDTSTVDSLRAFKFLDNDLVMNELKSELPAYLAAAEDVAVDVSPLTWWEHNAEKLPCWAKACKKVLLCQPSSACVERAFSLLSQFSDRQQSALEDYVEAALMLQYNK